MNEYNEPRNLVNPKKANILMSVIVVMLLLMVSLQIWILYGVLNASDGNQAFVWAAFGASLLLFIIGLWLLKYLPEIKPREVKDLENPYE